MPRRALLVAVLLIGCSEKAQQQAPVQRAPGVQASSIPAPAAPVPLWTRSPRSIGRLTI